MEYRALLSVPISADSDSAARDLADAYAEQVRTPDGHSVIGHTEAVFEVTRGSLDVERDVYMDPGFPRQVPNEAQRAIVTATLRERFRDLLDGAVRRVGERRRAA
jgi:hypothetical protein